MAEKKETKSWVYAVLGSVALVFAYIGTALPGIPGTPFILLTAWFFVRSNKRMYNWVRNHKLFGKIIRNFQKHEKVPLKFKIFVAVQLWISITVAQIWLISTDWVAWTVYVAGIITTIGIFKLKNTRIDETE